MTTFSTRCDTLAQYASLANSRILENQADLDPKDHAMPAMLNWCRSQKSIVVLQSGIILTSTPSTRLLQNCKIVMQDKGLQYNDIYPATPELIHLLLANAEELHFINNDKNENVTSQQQRLRILIKEALDLDATDIHIEIRKDIAKIRFRKHGELFLHAEWLPKLAKEIAAVAFNKETDHANTHFNPLIPQSASMPIFINDKEIRLRLASLPAHHGFDIVMRILTTGDDDIPQLKNLGYLPQQIQLFKKAINMPHGAVILSGPTGSGKTTTLASCMQLISSHRKIFTIEDPVEKIIANATQIPVNTEMSDRGFASLTKTTLRMDPDVIVLGEMRDEETAALMIRAAITGHLIFSTLHTHSAIDIITRLVDLEISLPLLSSPDILSCLICQRLVPLLCEHCAIPMSHADKVDHELNLRWQNKSNADVAKIKMRGSFCSHCHSQGIRGRTVVAEMIWVDDIGREFIRKGNLLGWQQHLLSTGWIPYRQRVIDLVLAGQCDPLDAEKMIGE